MAAYKVKKPLTCQEIADLIGVQVTNIRAQMCHYQGLKHKYFRRLKPKKGSRAYRYSITKFGRKTLLRYAQRIHKGFDLNLKARKIKTMPRYEIIMAERRAESDRRQAFLDVTGIDLPPKPKPTLKEILTITSEEPLDYVGVTKRGALELGVYWMPAEA